MKSFLQSTKIQSWKWLIIFTETLDVLRVELGLMGRADVVHNTKK